MTGSSDGYAELKARVTELGLLKRSSRHYAGLTTGHVATLLVIAVGMTIMRSSWWVLLWTLPGAFLFGQLGFLAHEATHNQISGRARINYLLSVFLFNLVLGGSRAWWADKHNTHHAQPNRIGVDPDIDGGPVAVSETQARELHGVWRALIRRQAVIIWPIMALGAMQIHAYSAGFLARRNLRKAGAESVLFALHHAAYFGGLILLLGWLPALVFALIHQALLGAYLGLVFLPNHVGMPTLEKDTAVDFASRQVLTARNLRAGRATDFVFGALSCQIEHHLFPRMPRHRLRAAAPAVRQFCAESGIAYHETSVWAAYAEVYRHLRRVARTIGHDFTAADTSQAVPSLSAAHRGAD